MLLNDVDGEVITKLHLITIRVKRHGSGWNTLAKQMDVSRS